MQIQISDWTWIDFILMTGITIFFLIGVLLLIPIIIYGYFRMGIKYGFTKKFDDGYLGNHMTIFKLVFFMISFYIGIHMLFIEGAFFKYWNNVILFFEII